MSSLLKQVEQTRKSMVKSGIQNGLLDEKTITLSRKLDELLNLYSQHEQLTLQSHTNATLN